MSVSLGAGPTPRAKGPSNFERRVDTISRVFQEVAEGRRVSQQQVTKPFREAALGAGDGAADGRERRAPRSSSSPPSERN